MRDVPEVREVLVPERLIQVVAVVQVLNDCVRKLLVLGEGPAGHRVHQEKRDRGHSPEDRDDPENPPDDVAGHKSEGGRRARSRAPRPISTYRARLYELAFTYQHSVHHVPGPLASIVPFG